MNAITYSLSRDIGPYYRELSQLTDRVLEKAKLLLPPIADFEDFIAGRKLETVRSSSLYQLELLSMALYWHNYSDAALGTPTGVADLCRRLLLERSRDPECKRQIDSVRGILNYKYLRPQPGDVPQGTTHVERFVLDLDRLESLIRWLEATGEFKAESRRFRNWQRYLRSVPLYQARSLLRGAAVLAHWFKDASERVLGKYTRRVDAFRRAMETRYRNREDVILCGRKRSDYHLIMVGAEIMNRALAPAFSQTTHRVVLLPGCMRPENHECRAKGNGEDLQCRQCRPDCNIGRVAARSAGAFDVRVVLHASDFTRLLEKWEGQTDTGLVASACVLHLFTGGYEMMALGIPAQCVFLEHVGCKRHWHEEGISTAIDEEQLLAVVRGEPREHHCSPTCLHCA